MYDKHEMFVTKKEYEESKVPQTTKYIMAFSQVMNFTPFFFITFFFIDKHVYIIISIIAFIK